MRPDLTLLLTITSYYAHPSRIFYMRCWGCKKHRILGEWWEGYQTGLPDSHWGWLCSSCTVIVASMVNDALHAEAASEAEGHAD